jgi:hypothetical protein
MTKKFSERIGREIILSFNNMLSKEVQFSICTLGRRTYYYFLEIVLKSFFGLLKFQNCLYFHLKLIFRLYKSSIIWQNFIHSTYRILFKYCLGIVNSFFFSVTFRFYKNICNMKGLILLASLHKMSKFYLLISLLSWRY